MALECLLSLKSPIFNNIACIVNRMSIHAIVRCIEIHKNLLVNKLYKGHNSQLLRSNCVHEFIFSFNFIFYYRWWHWNIGYCLPHKIFKKICKIVSITHNICRKVSLPTDTCRFTQIRTGSYRFLQIDTDYADSCRFINRFNQIHIYSGAQTGFFVRGSTFEILN